MLPKHLIPASPGPESDMSMHMSSEADDDDGGGDMDGLPRTCKSLSTLVRTAHHATLQLKIRTQVFDRGKKKIYHLSNVRVNEGVFCPVDRLDSSRSKT